MAKPHVAEGSPAVLASYVPPPVLRRLRADPTLPLTSSIERVSAAVLHADVSGFTLLTSRLAEQGPAGAEQLSRILDDYFGRLLAVIAAHGGEPIQIVGDALLALWPAEEEGLTAATLRAVQCALALQASRPSSPEAADVTVSLHIGIGAGGTQQMQIGGMQGHWNFVVAGEPLEQIGVAQRHVAAGEVVLSSEAWEQVREVCVGEARPEHCWRANAVTAPLPLTPARSVTPAALPSRVLEAFLPDPVRSRLAAGQAEWLAELRQVTALFVNLLELDHAGEGALEVMQRVMEVSQPLVQRHQGALADVIVDDKGCVLIVVFGVPPFVHEDDAVRGVRAAMALQTALQEAGHRTAIGLATGRAFCGAIGSDLRREYTVLGEAVNLAARLMQAAPDGILCDSATERLAAGRFAFEPLPALTVKGKAEPVSVFRPQGEVQARRRPRAEMVGRTRERAAFTEALQALRERGEGGVVVVEGEAGMGKSRLLEAVRTQAKTLELTALSSAADAVESATPYHSWRGVFTELLGLEELREREARRDQVERVLDPQLLPLAPLLEAMLLLGFPQSEQTAQLSGQVRAEATRDLFVTLLARAAAREPRVVFLEDAHWFDPASWALAEAVAERVRRVLLIVATRPLPEPSPADVTRLLTAPGTVRLTLQPLSTEDALELVCRRLGAARLSEPVEALIRERAAGHPLFTEELAYTLRDQALIEVVDGVCRAVPGVDLQTISFPHTVHGLVTSRIDQLSPQQQLTLKVASVIGAAFPFRVLHDIHPLRSDTPHLLDHLDALERSDLTRLQEPEPELIYGFKHIITREAAYSLLLYRQRRQLHQAAAEWYERAFEDLSEFYRVLAYHWQGAEVIPRAVEYLERSAVRTFSMGLGRESVAEGLEAARLLGVNLPTDPQQIVPLLDQEMAEIERLLAGRRPAELLDLPPLQDPPVAAIISLLFRIEPFAHQSLQPELFALMTLRNLRLTLEHGHGPVSPPVYALYSVVYRAMTGDSRTAYEFSRLALDLDARQGGHTHAYVSFVYTWFNRHWIEPLDEDVLQASLRASQAGFEEGDVLFGCFNLAAHVVYLATMGRPLEEVAAVAARHLALNNRRVLNAAFHCVHELQFAKALAGRTEHPLSLTDVEHGEERDVASILKTDHANQIGYYFISRLRLHYYYRDYTVALENAERALPLLPALQGQLGEIELVFFHALALLARSRQVGDAERERLLAAATAHLEKLRGWSELCEANVQHKLLLVRAELARTEGCAEEALELYRAAATSAERWGYVQHVALAHELAGALLHEQGDAAARAAFGEARAAYARWGAHAKVRDLEENSLRSGSPAAS
ncbi:MAG: AAA family ATPase [Gemmatimonadetes bacterium]|jgi:predicted ATPase/class 3 adenylate cyclase|nr:AAA family ATPase [Gemmatimonadota bacterium]